MLFISVFFTPCINNFIILDLYDNKSPAVLKISTRMNSCSFLANNGTAGIVLQNMSVARFHFSKSSLFNDLVSGQI